MARSQFTGITLLPLWLPVLRPPWTAGLSHLIDMPSKIISPMPASAPFLKLIAISKSYPGVLALSDYSMEVRAGEVIGLVGENGAGKSTLMKILGGVSTPDSGIIEINGLPHQGLSVSESMNAGIAFVHQELNLFDNLDVAANIFIGREPRKLGWLNIVDNEKLHANVQPYLDRLGANFSSSTLVSRLSLAQRQMVEIAKALSLNSRLVILDEPTSSLPIAETDKLLNVIAGLKANGIAVMFVSHRLNEVVEACDRVIVLRDGRLVGHLREKEITHDAMVKLMVGRDLKVAYATPANSAWRCCLVGAKTSHEDLSLRGSKYRFSPRRNSGPGGTGRGRTDRTCPRHVRSRCK